MFGFIKKKLLNYQYSIIKKLNEINFANVWHDTIGGVDWYNPHEKISPGRAAVGYNYLYVITRILDEIAPKSILDIGLGVSSTLIGMYSSKYNECEHIIVEHDEDWKNFYLQKHQMKSNSQICICKLELSSYLGEEYYKYNMDDFKAIVDGKKYTLISVDAPFGYNGGNYARRDIVDYIPQILNEEFVIVIDDYNRKGEKNTQKEICLKLDEEGLKYSLGIYSGETDICVIASNNLRFLCTL